MSPWQPLRQVFGDAAASRDELDGLRLEIERLRTFVETRAQAHEDMVRAMFARSASRFGETVEGRIQLAASEAIAFARRGLENHEAALRALGRRMAELPDLRSPDLPLQTPLGSPAAAGQFRIGAGADEADCQTLPLLGDGEDAFVAALTHLPILPGGAAKLVASHVVEFVSSSALAEKILPAWRTLLAPGGELVIVTLDGPAWAADLARGEDDFAPLRQRLGADGASRPLRRLFDAAELERTLAQSGFAPQPPSRGAGFSLRMAARLAAA